VNRAPDLLRDFLDDFNWNSCSRLPEDVLEAERDVVLEVGSAHVHGGQRIAGGEVTEKEANRKFGKSGKFQICLKSKFKRCSNWLKMRKLRFVN
jgi:hypothetical protein